MSGERVVAWRPEVPGVREVFHARFVAHAYPAHTHDTWTLLVVDEGAVRFDLERHPHGTTGEMVTLLPPHVPHDGRAATVDGFRKRVLYLDPDVLDPHLIGTTVDRPSVRDALLHRRITQLHRALARPADALEAESRLALVLDRLLRHLRQDAAPPARATSAVALADELRQLLDSRTTTGVTLREAADALGAPPDRLVRAFTRAFGLPPHRYLTGRRIDRARRLLLAGAAPATVAAEVGFHDQSHLHRHFQHYVGVPPGRYARSGAQQG
ncbi:AraC family transcriptional regulator [Virgisporangium aliadipatigenens]|uniref:AraC family transcriptional regulator n=1 Tax=Virgisporangium aliadipatigenens TaxID=741659 RepID=A0A8J4DTF1_9ACTN|nr:AraC family transcriptional regulator [Virgisporangium aliadipatigenens]GIJ48898.1 AraC family transcriptional regulator [Virgisporangium aliadipatigenens]